MTDQPRGEAPRGRNRRRRGYGGRGGTVGLAELLRASDFERWLNIAVGLMAVLYLILMVDRFHSDTVMIGFRPIDAPKAEILYGFGRPEAVSKDGGPWEKVEAATPIDSYDRWRYPSDGGGAFQFGFDAAGRSEYVTCGHAAGDRGACPGIFWTNMGDGEDRIAYQLGTAPLRILKDTSATLRYPAIGIDFELEQFKVRRITINRDRAPIYARIPQFLRFLIP